VKARAIPLTLNWYLLLWRTPGRFALAPLRTYNRDQERVRTIGATLSLWRLTLGVMRASPHGATCVGHWFRDFGQRLGRYSVGGWRITGRAVPVSTGWMVAGPPGGEEQRVGISITIASRTLYVIQLRTAAEQRAHYAYRPWPRRRRKS
jgi:hypothetical protein